jgi:SpoVK/Ycf46/Vps4 family AAA+-type ATPase
LRDLAASKLGERNRAGIGLAMRSLELRGDAPASDAWVLLEELEKALAAQAQPSSMRGIVAEFPTTGLSSVVTGGYVDEALKRLKLLCDWHSSLVTPGRAGVSALFVGPSGTGKTFAARALACELNRPLFRVDLAAVVSKWVGETEKNLRDAMAAAEAVGAVLLFDEGDALFGKRGEIAKGSDRYANVEVAYLLQAIEAFDGIAVATSNLRSNIDEAFERRFDVTIEFHAPDPRARALLWRQELGGAASRLSEQQLKWLGRAAELTGGGIACASRFARALALERSEQVVNESDLGTAVQNEFLKMGSTVQAAEWQRRLAADAARDRDKARR